MEQYSCPCPWHKWLDVTIEVHDKFPSDQPSDMEGGGISIFSGGRDDLISSVVSTLMSYKEVGQKFESES